MIKAVIFDLDGVIVHTDRYHYLAWKTVADELGITFDEEMNHLLRGVSRMDSMNIILEQNKVTLSKEEKEALTDKKNQVYREYLQKMSEKDLDKTVYNTLIQLKNSGMKIGIGSSSKNAKLILAQIGIIELFDTISDGTNISHSKPDPEVFQIAAFSMRETPKDCLVVEDATVGIEAGKKGGFITASIGTAIDPGFGDYHLGAIAELIDICVN